MFHRTTILVLTIFALSLIGCGDGGDTSGDITADTPAVDPHKAALQDLNDSMKEIASLISDVRSEASAKEQAPKIKAEVTTVVSLYAKAQELGEDSAVFREKFNARLSDQSQDLFRSIESRLSEYGDFGSEEGLEGEEEVKRKGPPEYLLIMDELEPLRELLFTPEDGVEGVDF
jgi:hypothetical protein